MRLLMLLGLMASLTLASGCSICAPGYLDDYAAVGGKWQRSDPSNGRVGSIFSDPGTTVGAPLADNEVLYDEGYGEQVFEGETYDGSAETYYEGEAGQPLELEQYEDDVITLGDGW